MSLALLLAALVALAVVALVALPFLRDPESRDDTLEALGDAARRRVELAEARDRALATLADLELDHRTGKISDDDYRAQLGPQRARAAEALRALEPEPELPEAPEPVPAPPPYGPGETPSEPVELPAPPDPREPPEPREVASAPR